MASRDAQVIKVAKALAGPTRFRLLQAIAARAEVSCQELTERFSLAQATVSHHLKVLSDAGLVRAEKRGAFHHYTARLEALEGLSADLAAALPAPRRAARAPRSVHRRAR